MIVPLATQFLCYGMSKALARRRCTASSVFIPPSARTGRTVFSQLSAAVVRHTANDSVVYAIRACFKYDTALSAVV